MCRPRESDRSRSRDPSLHQDHLDRHPRKAPQGTAVAWKMARFPCPYLTLGHWLRQRRGPSGRMRWRGTTRLIAWPSHLISTLQSSTGRAMTRRRAAPIRGSGGRTLGLEGGLWPSGCLSRPCPPLRLLRLLATAPPRRPTPPSPARVQPRGRPPGSPFPPPRSPPARAPQPDRAKVRRIVRRRERRPPDFPRDAGCSRPVLPIAAYHVLEVVLLGHQAVLGGHLRRVAQPLGDRMRRVPFHPVGLAGGPQILEQSRPG